MIQLDVPASRQSISCILGFRIEAARVTICNCMVKQHAGKLDIPMCRVLPGISTALLCCENVWEWSKPCFL